MKVNLTKNGIKTILFEINSLDNEDVLILRIMDKRKNKLKKPLLHISRLTKDFCTGNSYAEMEERKVREVIEK